VSNLTGRLARAEVAALQRKDGGLLTAEQWPEPGPALDAYRCDGLDGRVPDFRYGGPREHYHFTLAELEAAAAERGAQLLVVQWVSDWRPLGLTVEAAEVEAPDLAEVEAAPAAAVDPPAPAEATPRPARVMVAAEPAVSALEKARQELAARLLAEALAD
jgi:hypothetical protein